MTPSPFVFEPLFALLRAVFANTDVCVGLTLTDWAKPEKETTESIPAAASSLMFFMVIFLGLSGHLVIW